MSLINMDSSYHNTTSWTTPFVSSATDENHSDIMQHAGSPNGMPPMPSYNPQTNLFKKYAFPVTIVFGFLGNTVVFYIFTHTKLKRTSTVRYLAAVAITDNGFLLTAFFYHLGEYFNSTIHLNVGPCQLLTFGNYVFTFLSIWYLTAVYIEKYVGLNCPRKKSRMCTVFRAKCVTIGLAICGLVCYLYTTWFFGVRNFGYGKLCIMWDRNDIIQAWIILTKVDAVIVFMIPYITIAILTCLIAIKTWQYRRMTPTASERFLRQQRAYVPPNKEVRTTPLLFLLAVCTFLLCTPNCFYRIRVLFVPPESMHPTLEGDIFHYLALVHNAVKILVYTAASKSFAKQLGRLFCTIVAFLTCKQSRSPSSENELAGLNSEGKVTCTQNTPKRSERIL
ncbi:hypothetical protein CHS0354_018884 [Potamilus streckersoni]|uniref:G-protein coupled receptors family 1 profile domain-containing protein n=1 Tax=Potamilus streckersoni TaxID=2493646 RepID=A0AAE0SBV1_9BIVA|nr:hypothetical protein CHS0354_018884 [Potamilus streckersoni]